MANTPLKTDGLTYDEAVEPLTIMNECGEQVNADDSREVLRRLAEPPSMNNNECAPKGRTLLAARQMQ